MRRLAFILAILGIFILLALLNFQSPREITTPSQLNALPQNQKVVVSGKVVSERQYGQTKLLKLDNNITLECGACPEYLNKTISALGTIEKYENRTQISVLKIEIK